MIFAFLRDNAELPQIGKGTLNAGFLGPGIATLPQPSIPKQQAGLFVPEDSKSIGSAGAPELAPGFKHLDRPGRKARGS